LAFAGSRPHHLGVWMSRDGFPGGCTSRNVATKRPESTNLNHQQASRRVVIDPPLLLSAVPVGTANRRPQQ